MRKINCFCIDKRSKEELINSNISDELNSIIKDIRECGDVPDSEILSILRDNQRGPYAGRLSLTIDKLKELGMHKKEIDEKILEFRERDLIELEVGTPIGATEEEIKEVCVSTEKNRFCYAKVKRR